jgi:DinB superfamily
VNNTSSTIIADTGLTTEEITTASRHLSVTCGFLLESVGGLSPAQWNFKPNSETWSIAENLEHIVLIENGIHAIIERMNEPFEPVSESDRRGMDEFILTQIPKRSRKVKASENVCPTGRWSGPEALEQFIQSRGTKHPFAGFAPASRSCFSPSSLRSMGWLPMAVGRRISRRPAHGTAPRSESRQELPSGSKLVLRGRHALHDVDLLPRR